MCVLKLYVVCIISYESGFAASVTRMNDNRWILWTTDWAKGKATGRTNMERQPGGL